MNFQFANRVKEPGKLFLFDGYGALLSSFFYLVLLTNYSEFIGLPHNVLYALGGLAVMYAAYSFSCYLKKMDHWQPYLKGIAAANLFHCLLAVGVIIFYWPTITIWGILYFLGESLIVVPLALFEIKMANNS